MQSKPYHYYLGPWVWHEGTKEEPMEYWKSPDGTVGLVDLRTTSQMAKDGKSTPEGLGFFAVDGTLPSPYKEVASGYLSSTPLSNKAELGLSSGYETRGTTALDFVWEILTEGADAKGESAVKPLMPTADGNLELFLGGHSLVKSEPFVYGTHPHSSKVKEVLQNDYRKLRDFDKKHGKENYRKVLDMWSEKYKILNPEDEFIPSDLPKESRLKHSTVITEDFNKAQTSTLGPDLTWTAVQGVWGVSSNQALMWATTGNQAQRAESDLSGSDMYALIQIQNLGQDYDPFAVGTAVRFDSEANTHYNGIFAQDGNYFKLRKTVAGTVTDLDTDAITFSFPEEVKTTVSGSTLKGYQAGVERSSVTDTSITTGVRAGLSGYHNYNYCGPSDNFEAGDLVTKSCALTGTVTNDTEAEIVTGGSTIILTLTGDTFVASGSTFDAQRQNIINGIDSAQSEATGWDAVVKAGLAVTDVVRTSNTVVTVTLPAFATYNITATETITATVPSTALTGAAALVASPTFQITATSTATVRHLSLLGVGS